MTIEHEIESTLHEVDVMPGMVIRPGDVLVLSCLTQLSAQETAIVRDVVRARMPQLADVLIVAHPLAVSAVYRETKEGDT
jgi:hypothetical protein